MPDEPLWSILIATLASRHELLAGLLGVLLPQCEADGRVEVVGYYDNGEAPLAVKRQALLGAATGRYVSMVDDDDMVEPDFVEACTTAMASDPDFIAFEHAYYVNGHREGVRIVTGLQYRHIRWGEAPAERGQPRTLIRDVTQVNPVRRSIAVHGDFLKQTGAAEDWAYVAAIRPLLATQADVGRIMYHYRHRPHDSAQRHLAPHTGAPRLHVDSPCFRWIEP